MFDFTNNLNPTAATQPTQASQIQRQQQAADVDTAKAVLNDLQAPGSYREGFLEEAERLTLLARMGVDIDKLNEIEDKIEDLEAIDDRDDTQQAELESLLEERKELFREAMERQNGKSLPPGSMLSISV